MSSRTKNYVQVALWLSHEQRDRLDDMANRTRWPKQVLLRRAVEQLLRRHERSGKTEE